MIETSVCDTKPFGRDYLSQAASAVKISQRFHELRLCAEIALAAKGSHAVCVFVNDRTDRECLQSLAAFELKLIALRSAGCNNVDLEAAQSLGSSVVRVPAHSTPVAAIHCRCVSERLRRTAEPGCRCVV